MSVIVVGGLAGGFSGSIQASSKQAYNHAYYVAHRDERLAYQKGYNAGHREEISAYQKEYREENRDAISAYHKAYREEHRDAIRAHKKAYIEKHRDARLAYQKEYRAKQKRREQAYLAGFDWKTSEAVKWIEYPGLRNKLNDLNIKDFNLKVLNCIIEEVSLNEGLQVPRVAKRNRACAYKFINDHIDAFKQNLNNLTLSKLK